MITLTEKNADVQADVSTYMPEWMKAKGITPDLCISAETFFLCWWRRIAGSDTTKMMAIEENEITNAFCVINCRVAQST